eukprot:362347-Chlamydomonas_euryale.AAC.1
MKQPNSLKGQEQVKMWGNGGPASTPMEQPKPTNTSCARDSLGGSQGIRGQKIVPVSTSLSTSSRCKKQEFYICFHKARSYAASGAQEVF